MADLGNIHNELLHLIADYLSPEDLASLQLVCQSLNHKISDVTLLQPLYNRLYQIDKSLDAALDVNNAFVCFKKAFEKIRARQEVEIDYFKTQHNNIPVIPANTIEALQKRHALLNQVNIHRINECITLQGGLKLGLSTAGITRFIISENKKDYFANLQSLNISSNKLTTLNLEGCPNLRYVDCSENQLTLLSLKKSVNLEELHCTGNQLTDLNFEGFAWLQQVYCGRNPLVYVNVKGCAALKRIFSGDDNILAELIYQNLEGVSQIIKEKFEGIRLIEKENRIFKQLCFADFSERENLIKLLGESYNQENCYKYGCFYSPSLASFEDIQMIDEKENVFLPLMQSKDEELMDEDRNNDKRKRAEGKEEIEGPELKKHKPNSP